MAELSQSEVGRRYVLAAVVLLVLANVSVTVTYLMVRGADRLPQQLVRFLLLLGLGYALLHRKSWARWVTVILMLLGMWVSAGVLLAPGAFSRSQILRTLPMLALFIGYGVVGRGLIYSESVRAFFRGDSQLESTSAAG